VTQLICWTRTIIAKEPAVFARGSKEAAVSIFRTEETGLSTMLVPIYKTALVTSLEVIILKKAAATFFFLNKWHSTNFVISECRRIPATW